MSRLSLLHLSQGANCFPCLIHQLGPVGDIRRTSTVVNLPLKTKERRRRQTEIHGSNEDMTTKDKLHTIKAYVHHPLHVIRIGWLTMFITCVSRVTTTAVNQCCLTSFHHSLCNVAYSIIGYVKFRCTVLRM